MVKPFEKAGKNVIPTENLRSTTNAEVVTEFVVFPNRSGLKITACWDHARENFAGCPFVLMAPKYGETKKASLQLGYLLAANGMNVLRFDHTCQIGESAGARSSFTLSTGLDDILGALDFLEARFGVGSASVIASSLAARTAIRAAALDRRINHLVCIVGVVNLRHTLEGVYGEDVIANYQRGKRWGVTDNLFGWKADWDVFLGDACTLGLHTLEGTANDLKSIAVPVVFFSGEDDAWVELAEVTTLVAQAKRASLVRLASTKHEVRENAAGWAGVFQEIACVIVREAWGLADRPATIRAPSKRCLLEENRVERQRLRKALAPDGDETAFWTDYLGKYIVLEHVDDFANYLSLVCELLEPLEPGSRLLDAGCGNGMLGTWLMRRPLWREAVGDPLLYVGVDLTAGGLAAAQARHGSIQAGRFRGSSGHLGRSVDLFYATADFDGLDGPDPSMPRFGDATFDAVCCSLVLSYLEKPGRLLRELRRLLRPGGRLVVSSMKPHCDVSNIYRGFVESRTTRMEVESARGMLGGVQEILVKQELGLYEFYSGEELAAKVTEAGFGEVQVFSSFGDQVVVVRALA